MEDSGIVVTTHAPFAVGELADPSNTVEGYKASMGGGLRILEHPPQIMERGAELPTPGEGIGGVFYTESEGLLLKERC